MSLFKTIKNPKSFVKLSINCLLPLMAVLALYSCAGALFVTLLPTQKELLETVLSKATNNAVRIGSITGSWHDFRPSVLFQNLTIYTATNSTPLSIDRGYFDLNPLQSLLTLSPVAHRIFIQNLKVKLWQSQNGLIHLKGSPPTETSTDIAPFIDLLLNSQSVTLKDSLISLESERFETVAQVLQVFASVNIENSNDQHRIALTLKGDDQTNCLRDCDLSLLAEIAGDWRDTQTWNGDIQIKSKRLALEKWYRIMFPTQPLLNPEIADLNISINLQSGLPRAVDFSIATVSGTKIDSTNNQWKLSQLVLQSRQNTPDSWYSNLQIGASNIDNIITGTQNAQAFLTYAQNSVQKLWLIIDTVQTLPIISIILPFLGESVQKVQLATTRPDIRLDNINVFLEKQADTEATFAVSADILTVSSNAFREIPEIKSSGTVGKLLFFESGGLVQIESDILSLYFMNHFDEPFALSSVKGNLRFSFSAKLIDVFAENIKFNLPIGDLGMNFNIHLTPDESTNLLTLQIGLTSGDLVKLSDYFPNNIFPDIKKWLQESLLSGHIDQGGLFFNAYLAKHLPGVPIDRINFSINVKDAVIKYAPDWPEMRNLDATILVSDKSVRGFATKGSVFDIAFDSGSFHIPFGKKNLKAFLDFSLHDDLAKLSSFIRETPARQEVPKEILSWQMQGATSATLQLQVPLGFAEPINLNIDLSMPAAQVYMPQPDVNLTNISGNLVWDSVAGVSAETLNMNFLEAPVTASLYSERDNSGQINIFAHFSGRANTEKLAEWLYFPYHSLVPGDFEYQGLITIDPRSQINIKVDSNISASAISSLVPEIIRNKFKEDSHVEIQYQSAPGKKDRMQLNMGKHIQGLFLYSDSGFERGKFTFTDTLGRAIDLTLPNSTGLTIECYVSNLQFFEWKDFVDTLEVLDDSYRVQKASTDDSEFSIQNIKVTGERIIAVDYVINNFDLNVDPIVNTSDWDIKLQSNDLNGQFIVYEDDAIPIEANIDSVYLYSSEDSTKDIFQDLEFPRLPLIRVAIKEAYLDQKLYANDTSFLLTPHSDNLVMIEEFKSRLNHLNVYGDNPDSGAIIRWQKDSSGLKTFFKGKVGLDYDKKDAVDLLANLDNPNIITARHAELEINADWPGSPQMYELDTINGSLSISLKDGNLQEINKGVGISKVISLINISVLLNLAKFDFSDFEGKGMSFKKITGNLVFNSGSVQIQGNPLKINTNSFDININGGVNLNTGTLNGNFILVLPISKGLSSYAVYTGFAGGPFVGGLILALERLFRGVVNRISSFRYKVTGTLEDPEIKFEKILVNPNG